MSSGGYQQLPPVARNSICTELQRGELAGNLLETLAMLRRDAAHCDVFLQVESASIEAAGEAASSTTNEVASEASGVWAHRVVLAAVSPYFRMRFNRSFTESAKEIVVIKGVKLETLRALIDNIYLPSSLVMPVENAIALLAAATQLTVTDVRDETCAFLARALAPNNALGIRTAAVVYGCTALAAAATRYIQYHGERVLEEDEVLELSPDALFALLSNNRLATREERVFEVVLRWTLHCPQDRKQHVSSLLRAVRLPSVPRSLLSISARTEPLASTPAALIPIVLELTSDREKPAVTRRRPPRNTQPPAALLVIGGWLDDTGCTRSVLVCPLAGGRWQSAAPLPAPRDNAGAAQLDGRVYVVGGQEDELTHVRTVFEYDAALDTWRVGPPLGAARGWPGAAAAGGRLYAAGGWDGTEWRHNTVYRSVEALDPREGVWRPVANMCTARAGLGLAELGDMLYAVGGYDGTIQLNSTERYDPRANRWETVEAMAERRDNVRVAVVDEALYAVGGKDERSKRLRSVERYCAGSGWELAPAITAARGNAAVVAHGGRLYAAGGHNGRRRINNVSVFDPATALWNELPALPAPRSAAVAAVVVVAWPLSADP